MHNFTPERMISRDNTIQISSVFDAQIQPECGTPNMYVTLRKMDDAWFDLVDEKLTEHYHCHRNMLQILLWLGELNK